MCVYVYVYACTYTHTRIRTRIRVCVRLLLYILATSKLIAGPVLTCDSVHSVIILILSQPVVALS